VGAGRGPPTEEQRRALRATVTSRYKLTPQAGIPLVLTIYPRIKASEFVESRLKVFDLQLDPLQCLGPSEFGNGHGYWRISLLASTLDSAFILAIFDLPQPSCSPAQLAEFPGGLHALAAAHYVEDPSVAPAEGFEHYTLNRWTGYYQMGAVWEDHVERASELRVVPYFRTDDKGYTPRETRPEEAPAGYHTSGGRVPESVKGNRGAASEKLAVYENQPFPPGTTRWVQDRFGPNPQVLRHAVFQGEACTGCVCFSPSWRP
jgi:hypothetical protein